MTRVVAEMTQQNTVLHTINLFPNERDERIYAEMIQPYLKTNLYSLQTTGTRHLESGYSAPETFVRAGAANRVCPSNLLDFPAGESGCCDAIESRRGARRREQQVYQ
jgi:hypothetical protein